VPLSFDATGFRPEDQTTRVHSVTGNLVALEYFALVPDLPASLADLPTLPHDLVLLHRQHPYVPDHTGKLPYSACDNPQFPEHPLTRAGAWIAHALRTARVDPASAVPAAVLNRTVSGARSSGGQGRGRTEDA
jgi:hypothetical protein